MRAGSMWSGRARSGRIGPLADRQQWKVCSHWMVRTHGPPIQGHKSFGVFFVKAAWVVIQMPGVDEGPAQVGSIQWWGWTASGLYVAGFVILSLVSETAGRRTRRCARPGPLCRFWEFVAPSRGPDR
jgi:hypothetical protein